MSEYYIGLMSGTSLDGVDAVLVDFSQSKPTLVESYSHPFPEDLRKELITTTQPDWKGTLLTIGTLDQKLGYLFADAVNQLIHQTQIPTENIIAIGSHGQTLWHEPTGEFPFSLQLGNANIISEQTNISTVADFRNRDIAAGGEGAPLVPAFHFEYLTHPTKNRILLNIGGIANISYLPAENNKKSGVFGFDTGPGNGLIDAWISKHQSTSYDKGGEWALSGNTSIDLLNTMLKDPFFSLEPPKSTGKEYFNLHWLETNFNEFLHSQKPEDIQSTLTELTATSIANAAPACDEMFIFGGGIHNAFLVNLLKIHLPKTDIHSSKVIGINPDWMEAIAFAWLAKKTLSAQAGNLPESTGATAPRILGAVYQKA